jgi:PIN domain nuclease of toxin-antitoxin system
MLAQGLREVAVDGDIALSAAELAGLHGDPADRMIVATAIANDAVLLTADDDILRWRGSARRMDARR